MVAMNDMLIRDYIQQKQSLYVLCNNSLSERSFGQNKLSTNFCWVCYGRTKPRANLHCLRGLGQRIATPSSHSLAI